MNRTDLTALMERTFGQVRTLNSSKGREYADDDEALRNFYNRADEFGTDPLVVCGIFLGKHLDAIKAYIKAGEVLSEGIDGRIHDAILYLVLLLGLVEDGRSDEQSIVEHAGENQLALLDEQAQVPTVAEVRAKFLPIEHEAHNVVDATQPSPVPRIDHGPVWTEETFRQRAAEDGIPVEGAA